MLRAAAKNSTPLLLTSTSEVYGKSAKPEFSEDDDLLIGPPGQSRWSYACSKLTDEFLALAYAREKNLPVTIARLFNTVGPRQTGRYGMVLPRWTLYLLERRAAARFRRRQTDALLLLRGRHRARSDRSRRTPRKLEAKPSTWVGHNEISILDLATRIIELTDSSSEIVLVPYEQAYGEGYEDMRRRVPDNSQRRADAWASSRPPAWTRSSMRSLQA